ncbi:MAG: WecB/TagA/CpsF family glycosyltransferase [Sporolactobacillus sp.]
MTQTRLFSIKIDCLTLQEAVNAVINLALRKDRYSYVVTPNVDHIVKLQHDKEFLNVYQHASLVLPDGQPLVWVSKLFHCPLIERVSGSDVFPLICKAAVGNNLRIFLLGGQKGVAGQAARRLVNRFPGLQIVGTYSPNFGFEKNYDENQKIIREITELDVDILFVGVGAPKQEKWIYEHLNELKVPVSLGIGASLDFEAGTVKRAPIWMRKVGLEWLWRLLHEPRRLGKRYVLDIVYFALLSLRELKNRCSKKC